VVGCQILNQLSVRGYRCRQNLTVNVGFEGEVDDSAAITGSSSAYAEPARRADERMAEATAALSRMMEIKLQVRGLRTNNSLARNVEKKEG
jgi:hypothetical protein